MLTELEKARGEAWSIENMEAHGASDRKVELIGQEDVNGATFWYYRDEKGMYWYKSSHGAELDEANRHRRLGCKIAKK